MHFRLSSVAILVGTFMLTAAQDSSYAVCTTALNHVQQCVSQAGGTGRLNAIPTSSLVTCACCSQSTAVASLYSICSVYLASAQPQLIDQISALSEVYSVCSASQAFCGGSIQITSTSSTSSFLPTSSILNSTGTTSYSTPSSTTTPALLTSPSSTTPIITSPGPITTSHSTTESVQPSAEAAPSTTSSPGNHLIVYSKGILVIGMSTIVLIIMSAQLP